MAGLQSPDLVSARVDRGDDEPRFSELAYVTASLAAKILKQKEQLPELDQQHAEIIEAWVLAAYRELGKER